MSLSFQDILQPIIYSRDDDEPVRALELIYPFDEVNSLNQYSYEAVFPYVSAVGFKEIIPSVLKWICNPDFSENGYPIGLESNLMEQFAYSLNETVFWNRVIIPSLRGMDGEEKELLERLILPVLSLEIIDNRDRMPIEKFLSAIRETTL